MARDAVADLALLRLIHEKAQSGHHAEASVLAEAALAEGLEHPLLLNLVALKLEREGRIGESEIRLRRAVEIAPNDIAVRNALGLCLMQLERPAEAVVQFDALLTLNSSLPFAHASLGEAFFALGLVAEAEAAYRRALALDPDQGTALVGLARIANARGAYGDARLSAERALHIMPDAPAAVMGLARAELGERSLVSAEARLRSLLDRDGLAPIERVYATGILGDVLDAKGYADEAFATYEACNRLLASMHAGRFTGADNALFFVRSMNDYFSARSNVWSSRVPPDSRRTGAAAHVFVLGFPRSGTTLLEVVLEGHPNVVSLDESESLIDVVNEFMRHPDDLDRLAAASPSTLERLRERYWQRVASAGVDVLGKMFVDKNPLNSLKLPLIARLFPGAKILFACRDPRDVVLSCFRHRFVMSAPIYELLTLDGAARYYDAVMQLLVRLTGTLSLDVCLVRHEDVVTEFAREMKRVCTFLGLEWDPAMGDFALRSKKREVLTPSAAQLVKGLNTEGLGQWRRYRSHMEPVLPTLEPWIKRFLYEDR